MRLFTPHRTASRFVPARLPRLTSHLEEMQADGLLRIPCGTHASGQQRASTAVYNRFHDPDSDCECVDIRVLRDLRCGTRPRSPRRLPLDDLRPHCEFIPEFDDEEDENGRPRRKKFRYRWPDEIRDDVLARLLELNRQRAVEEGPTAD